VWLPNVGLRNLSENSVNNCVKNSGRIRPNFFAKSKTRSRNLEISNVFFRSPFLAVGTDSVFQRLVRIHKKQCCLFTQTVLLSTCVVETREKQKYDTSACQAMVVMMMLQK